MSKSAHSLVRPLVRRLHAYVPGEQPRIKGLIKLNTNENPYPPSPKVLRAVKESVDQRLRLYPNPIAQHLRERLAKLHRCAPENIIVGNGSDELLAMAVRCFVEPAKPNSRDSRSMVQSFNPSYSLYPVLADSHGAKHESIPLHADFSLPSLFELERGKRWDFRAALSFVTTPNAPSGRAYPTSELKVLCQAQKGVIVLDEAYVDFADENALPLALKYPNVLVARTFSKAYSLCFQRIGYFVGSIELIDGLQKIRDSYNVNGLGQIAALATLDDLTYYQKNFRRIIATRENLTKDLSALGFQVFPSQTNFLLVLPPKYPAETWLKKLRQEKILIRWFKHPEVRNYLRITIGTSDEVAALVRAINKILGGR